MNEKWWWDWPQESKKSLKVKWHNRKNFRRTSEAINRSASVPSVTGLAGTRSITKFYIGLHCCKISHWSGKKDINFYGRKVRRFIFFIFKLLILFLVATNFGLHSNFVWSCLVKTEENKTITSEHSRHLLCARGRGRGAAKSYTPTLT